MSKLILIALIQVGCVTPRHYKPADHQENMIMCSSSCHESGSRMKSYSSVTGRCECE